MQTDKKNNYVNFNLLLMFLFGSHFLCAHDLLLFCIKLQFNQVELERGGLYQ